MKTIYKFQLRPADTQTLRIPKGADFLSVHEQRGHICVWAIVDDSADSQDREFLVVGTGHAIPITKDDCLQFIGTVLMAGGSLVWHVFVRLI